MTGDETPTQATDEDATGTARAALANLQRRVDQGDLHQLGSLAQAAAILAVAEQVGRLVAQLQHPAPKAAATFEERLQRAKAEGTALGLLPNTDAVADLAYHADNSRTLRETHVLELPSRAEQDVLIQASSAYGYSVTRDTTVGDLLHRIGAFEWVRNRPQVEDDSDRLERLHRWLAVNPDATLADCAVTDVQWLQQEWRTAQLGPPLSARTPLASLLRAVTR